MCCVDARQSPLRLAAASWVTAVFAGLALAGCGTYIANYGHVLANSHATARPAVPAPGLPVPASAIHRLTAIARDVAMTEGRSAPAWATAVVTTHARALTSATPGDVAPIGENTIVYLVTMKGHFTDGRAPGPAGVRPPTGRYLSLVVNAKSFLVTDFGLSAKAPPVAAASLGPATELMP